VLSWIIPSGRECDPIFYLVKLEFLGRETTASADRPRKGPKMNNDLQRQLAGASKDQIDALTNPPKSTGQLRFGGWLTLALIGAGVLALLAPSLMGALFATAKWILTGLVWAAIAAVVYFAYQFVKNLLWPQVGASSDGES
jgi:hypothetical protein